MVSLMLLQLSLTIITVILVIETQARQTWIQEPQYAEVNPGETVLLTCIIANQEGECRWEKEGVPIGIFPGKYEWNGDNRNGDCSLLIRDAELEFDDGNWQCSVTPSRFKARDALVSNVSSLVVRTVPESLVIEQVNILSDTSDDTIEVLENTNVTLRCRSVGGKPPPRLSWQLPDTLPSFSLSETVQNGSAISVISALPVRNDTGKLIQCKATHDALVEPLEKSVKLNVLYVPVVEVEYQGPNSLVTSSYSGSDQNVSLREGETVIIRCRADANPGASVMWRRAGVRGVWSTEPEVVLDNVGKEEAGVYTCTAHNSLGVSGPKEIILNVEYSPTIVSLSPSGLVTSKVGSRVSLTCHADANPGPAYQWVQKLNDQIVIRGNSQVLTIDNIIFEDDGEYICHAHNQIRGQERITQSAPVHLQVRGPPRLYLDPKTRFETSSGSDYSIEVKVCGEPRPDVQWQVDHLWLTAGSGHGKYRAHPLHKLSSHHSCYISRLSLQAADREDSKHYQVHVKNGLGEESHSLELLVHENSQVEVLVAIAVGGVLTILTICLIIIYILVSRDHWTTCFRFKQHPPRGQCSDISELGSDKTDIESPDSSIITSSAVANNHIYYHDLRQGQDNSFHTFNRQKPPHQSVIPCGAYSVTQGSISSISPHSHRTQERSFNDCPRFSGLSIDRSMAGSRMSSGVTTRVRTSDPPPDLSGVSYYRYN